MGLPPELALDRLDRPIHRQDKYLAAMCYLLTDLNGLLEQIRDRLPEPTSTAPEGGTVELREPVSPGEPVPSSERGLVRQADAAEPAPDVAPRKPASTARPRRSTTKASRSRTATKKEEVPDGSA
ncbi:hypothetical protein [Sphaerisporangium aureirubrum]|uniref:Transposase n=1 Tax=Sphaerisporangium aureirubrum TaxID=1544736 RepID=A0ABW1NE12_9ACTN